MLRGHQSTNLIYPTSVQSNPERKGHRNVHIERRDEVLTARFYYYYHIKRQRYDDILLDLEKEFFITPDVVVQRLRLTGDIAKELLKKDTTTSDLKKLHPLYKWD